MDTLHFLEAETQEVPIVGAGPPGSDEPAPRAKDGASRDATRNVSGPDLVADVLGPDASLGARPKPSVLQPAVDAIRSWLAVLARPQVAGVVITGCGLLILLLLGYIYVFTPLSAQRAQHTLLQRITADPVGTFGLAEGKVPPTGSPVAILDIPALHLVDAVVEGSSAQDLQEGPGHMPTTPLPGQPGNAVIAGRRATYGAPFGAIGTLRKGEVIEVVDGYGTFHYRVSRIVTAKGGRHDVVTSTKANRLTLVTAGSGIYPTGRLAVIAKLDGKPFQGSTVRRFDPAPSELGLSGDPASGLLALLWSALFLALLGGMVWLLRHWSQPVVVYLLAVPVLLLVGLFACESFVGFLPATL